MRRAPPRRSCPTCPVVAGTAEALPFADASLDAVTVAQAFHWFDADRRVRRARRVLRPGGRARAGLERARPLASTGSTRSGRSWTGSRSARRGATTSAGRDAALGDRAGFGPLHEATFRHEQVLTRDGVVERFRVGEPRRGAPRRPSEHAVLDEVRDVLDTHPATAGQARARDPLPGRRVLVRAARVTRSLRTPARASPPGGPPAGCRASPAAGQGATISGRVMNAHRTRRCSRELAARPARRARVGDERQDHDDAPARRRRCAADGRPVVDQLDRRQPHVGHRADARPRPTGRASRCSRSTSACCRTCRRPARRRAARARQPQPRPARPLRRGARRRRRVARGRRGASRPRDRRQRVRPARGVGGAAGEGHVGRRSGCGWRHDAATCPSCGALLDWSDDRFDCPTLRLRPARHAATGSTATTLVLDGAAHPAATSQLPGAWNRANAALAPSPRPTHFGDRPDARPRRAARPSTSVAGRFMPRPARRRPRRARAPRQEPGRLDRGAALRRRAATGAASSSR